MNGPIFGKKKMFLNVKCVIYFLYNFCLKYFSSKISVRGLKVYVILVRF